MSSFEHLVKDKRSLVYEILFSLEGIVGDLVAFADNFNQKHLKLNDLTLNSSISISEVNFIKGLLETANHYNRINSLVQKYSSDSNSYNRRLAQTIDDLLIDYRNDLIEVEKDINRDSNYSLIKFNKFFKYSQTFEFLNEMISQLDNEGNSYVSALDLMNKSSFSGFSQIQNSAKIIQKSSDCLYSDILSWILFGFLTERSKNHFFIKETDGERIELDITRVPSFIQLKDAFKVLKIGETVRWYERRGVKNLFVDKNNDLFECLKHLMKEESVDKTIFADFLESVRKIVSEYSWNYVINEQPFREHFHRIKNIFLTSSDNFWSNFVSQNSKIQSNGQKYRQKEIEKTFETSLRLVFSDNTVNQILSEFSIIAKSGSKLSYFLDYRIPMSLENIISNDSLDKYNEIMSFMQRLYSSRFQLNQIWLNTTKTKVDSLSSLRMKILVLRHSLSFIINAFYNYFKTDVIEILFSQFMDRIDETKDIEVIQKEHQILLTEIMGQMFLKTSVINQCFEQLFLQCKQLNQCLESEDSINRLIEDFERTKGQTYHLLVNIEAYKTNKTIANLVLDIEKCSKQQIILN